MSQRLVVLLVLMSTSQAQTCETRLTVNAISCHHEEVIQATTMTNTDQPRHPLVGSGKREEPSLMNLPTNLAQQAPLYRTQFYVEEASLYSIAEDSREDRQSEITSRAGTVSTASTPVSVKLEPPFSLGASALTTDWELDDDEWDWNRSGGIYDNTLLTAAKRSRWVPPNIQHLDAEEFSNPNEVIYPIAVGDPLPTKQRGCRGGVLVYCSLVVVLLASIATIASIPILRKTTSSPKPTRTGVQEDPSFGSASPSAAPSQLPTQEPTPVPTFPPQIGAQDERYLYDVLKSCNANDLHEALDQQTVQFLTFNNLVRELTDLPDTSAEVLLERWALVVLFLSTHGELWLDGGSWYLLNKDVCEWGVNTITCEPRLSGQAAVTALHLSM